MKIENKRNKSYTIRKIESRLNGMTNHITEGTDVESNPFPFTEEQSISSEQFHFGAIESNRPL